MTTDQTDDWSDAEQQAFLVQKSSRRQARLALYRALEQRLGIPCSFIEKLFAEENDWAFIVKLAVLCEAAVTDALVNQVARDSNDIPVWYDHFSSLTNGRRLQLAVRLSVLSRADGDALDAIAQIRNAFAHDVGNLAGTLSDYFNALHADKKVELASKLLGIQHYAGRENWRFYTANTKLLIIAGALKPILTLAQRGLDASNDAELKQRWELADMFPSQSLNPSQSD